jgi:hypothetical protein
MDEHSAHSELRRLVIEYADTGFDIGEIYEKIEANHPDVVDSFVLSQRPMLVRQAIRMIVGSKRRQRIHQARFAAAAEKIEAGENLFLNSYPTEDGRKTLVEMTKSEVRYARRVLESQADDLVWHARLLARIERKVPEGKTVGDVFTAEQLSRIFGERAT